MAPIAGAGFDFPGDSALRRPRKYLKWWFDKLTTNADCSGTVPPEFVEGPAILRERDLS